MGGRESGEDGKGERERGMTGEERKVERKGQEKREGEERRNAYKNEPVVFCTKFQLDWYTVSHCGAKIAKIDLPQFDQILNLVGIFCPSPS